MLGPYFSASATNSWMKFVVHYTQMNMAAAEVIARRTMKMAQGGMGAAEAVGMVAEKATTMAIAGEKAAVAVARGADPLSIASAALRPYRTKTRSNVRRLRD